MLSYDDHMHHTRHTLIEGHIRRPRTVISFWNDDRHKARYDEPRTADADGSARMRMHVTMCSNESWSILVVRVADVDCPSSMMPHMTSRQPTLIALASRASSPAV